MNKVIIFYTNNDIELPILKASIRSIMTAKGEIPLVITAQDQIPFLCHSQYNLVNKRAKNHASMYKQILESLTIAARYKPDHVFFCEHDVLYPEGYFDQVEPVQDGFSYTDNKLYYDAPTKRLVEWPGNISLSTLFCRYDLALSAFNRRVYRCDKMHMDKAGWTCSEPGKSTKQTRFKRLGWCTDDTTGDYTIREYDLPLIDIRNGHNLSKASMHDKKETVCKYWKEELEELEKELA